MAKDIPHAAFTIDWARGMHFLKLWLAAPDKKKPPALPHAIRKLGKEHITLKEGSVYYKGLEVITDEERKQKILTKEEQAYGGSKAIYYRLRKHYLGISYQNVRDFLNRSERRQLKQSRKNQKSNISFIHAPRPGSLQADCTFYHGNKIVVFGVVDVFSRWCYYEIIKHKQPIDTAAAMIKAVAAFKKLAPDQSIYKIATDDGGEFKLDNRNKGLSQKNPKFKMDWQTYWDNYKESGPKWRLTFVREKAPQRLIESLNGTLRKYVERVDYKDKAELRKIIERFVREYNDTRHRALGRLTPNDDAMQLSKEETKAEAKRQFKQKRGNVGKSGYRQKVLREGDLVRISLLSDKDKMGHIGSKEQWTKALYKVDRVIKSKRGVRLFRIVYKSTGNKKGVYMRNKLLFVYEPTHSKDQKPKYDPGAETDVESEDEAPKPQWVKAQKKAAAEANKDKPNYKAQDVRESSGDEASIDYDDQDTEDMEEKAPEPPPKKVKKPEPKKVPQPKPKPKPKEPEKPAPKPKPKPKPKEAKKPAPKPKEAKPAAKPAKPKQQPEQPKPDPPKDTPSQASPKRRRRLAVKTGKIPLSKKKIKGRKVTVDYNGDIIKAIILLFYKGEYIIYCKPDGSIGAVVEKEVVEHDIDDYVSEGYYKRLMHQKSDQIAAMQADIDADQ